MPDLLIKNAKIFYANYLQPAEIVIDEGKISRIVKEADVTAGEIIDADGSLVIPAGIDVHVHFREPGLSQKEDWYTGSCAAAAGGITTVIDHPNTLPPTVDKKSFEEKLKLASRKSIVDFGIHGGVTNNLDKLHELWEEGVTAFGEIFMAESTGGLNIDATTLECALGFIKQFGALAAIHAEDDSIRRECEALLKNDVSPSSHSRTRPNLCEAAAVQKAVELLRKTGARGHICHVSAFEALGVLARDRYIARQKGLPTITCEVTPHHLFLSTRDWDRLGSFGKMNPPLRDRRNVKFLLNSLNDGSVDIVASDHAPHCENEKDVDIKTSPAGVPGVETLMPLMLMAVKKNLLPLGRMIDATSAAPARIFGLDRHHKGRLEVGFDADLIIVDTKRITHIKGDHLHGKSKWTPFEGFEAIFPKITISRGDVIWDGEISASYGRGIFLPGKGKIVDIDEHH
jgi:dihydroorotase